MSAPVSNLLKSSLISLAATVISLAAGFAGSIIAARLLGPAGSGKVAYALWVATSATALADMGLPQTLLRNAGGFSGEGDGWKALVRAALRSFMISVAMVGVAILVFAAITYAYRDARHAWFWIATALLFLSYAFYVFSTAVARGRHRFGQTARSTVLGGVLQAMSPAICRRPCNCAVISTAVFPPPAAH
jgi:O-antigen/teichoic acid export membrane protein